MTSISDLVFRLLRNFAGEGGVLYSPSPPLPVNAWVDYPVPARVIDRRLKKKNEIHWVVYLALIAVSLAAATASITVQDFGQVITWPHDFVGHVSQGAMHLPP